MSTDATSSWSGYIFQGDVALCKAIEVMNDIGLGNAGTPYFLRLEEDEDFSLSTNHNQYFQVKAYTAHNYTKYKKAWNDMMARFPAHPENNFMFIHKADVDKTKFDDVNNSDQIEDNLISGVYTLSNINQKLKESIVQYLNDPQLTDADIDNKLIYCSKRVSDYVKERHRTNVIRQIPLTEIDTWLRNAPSVINEDLFWHTIEKLFFDSLSEISEMLDVSIGNELIEYNLLADAVVQLESLSNMDFRNLFLAYINSTKKLNVDFRYSLADYTKSSDIQNIIGRALRKISIKPVYKKLCYNLKVDALTERYQLTTFTEDYDMNDRIERSKFRKFCEDLLKSPSSSDTDFYVTRLINRSREEMQDDLKNITMVPEEGNDDGDGSSIILNGDDKIFGLINITDAIERLTQI